MNPKHQTIIEDYKSGLSLLNTAKKNKCSQGTVRHALKANGVHTRPSHYTLKVGAGKSRPSPKPIHRPEERHDRPQRKYEVREELLRLAKNVCEKQGGISHIDNRYAIVDTQRYKVEAK